MKTTEKSLEECFPSTEFEHQSLVITVPNDCQETVSPQSSLSAQSQNTTPSSKVKNSLHVSKGSLNDELEFQEAFSGASSLVRKIQNPRQKLKTLKLIFQSPQSGKTIL